MNSIEDIDLAKLGLVKYPDPVLGRTCPEVTEFSPGLQALADRMLEIMYAARGVGLAATQVGLAVRMFVCNPTPEWPEGQGVCLNPRIVDASGELVAEEGCLSVPGVAGRIKRFKRVALRAVDLHGKPIELLGEDLTARVFQHEVDHLNGMLVIDRMSAVGKLTNRRTLKELEAEYDERRSG